MPGAHASRTTVRELSLAIADNERRSGAALDSGQRGATEVVRKVTTELRVREREVDSALAALRSCESQEDADCSRQRQRLFDAEQSRALAQRILERVEAAREEFRSASLRLMTTGGRLVTGGRRFLAEQAAMIDDYAGMATPVVASAAARTGQAAGAGPGGASRPAGLPEGIEMVPLSAIDMSASTVTSEADFSQYYSPKDLDWAFDALEQVVLPALAAGESPDVFAERDARAGLMGTKSYAMTYSQFLGKQDGIVLHPGPNGYTIGNGQHRIWVAQHGGRAAVPARIMP